MSDIGRRPDAAPGMAPGRFSEKRMRLRLSLIHIPLGAFVARHEVMDTLQENPALGHITTFGGHPVCCAAGLAALNYLVDNKVVERVETKGALYEMLLKDHPAVQMCIRDR